MLVALVVLFLIIKACSHTPASLPPETNQTHTAAPVAPVAHSARKSLPTGQHVITSENKWGCTDREYVDKLFGFVVDQDKEAFMRAISAGIATGHCTTFKVGEPVFLADTAIMSGLVKLRRKGETIEYWTAVEAIN